MDYLSGFSYGEFPYEEHFPTSHELHEREERMPRAADLYCEVHCHFNICMDLSDRRKGGLFFTKLAKYLIRDLKFLKTLKAISLPEVEARVSSVEGQRDQTYTTFQVEDGFADGTLF